jgi:hypothetical protein
MILIGLVAMYSLLNTGNPDSLLRAIIPNPAHDLYVAVLGTGIYTGFFCVFLPGPGRFSAADRIERRQDPVHAQKKKDRYANSRFHSGRHGQHRRLPAQYGQKKTHRLFIRI